MALIPLTIQAGFYRNGTDFEQSNRWRDGNLVRWRNNSLRPVGGWEVRKAASTTYAPRGLIAWADNSGDSNIAIATYAKLYYMSATGTVTDITPVGFTSGTEDAALNNGFGGGNYGQGAYGVETQSSGVFGECTTWALDTWGEYLVGCSVDDGKLYEWQLNPAAVAAAITNAPTSCLGLVVTQERFIFALGAGGNPRKIAWCDREDNTTWTAADTNEAGDIELQTQGAIKCAIRVRGRTLILTDQDAHLATYQGPPYVYGFERVGTSCGVISRRSVVAIDEGAFWMGERSFFGFDGSVASEIKCDVLDYVFGDLNRDQKSKITATSNSQFGEIWWFYPSAGTLENDRYVTYNYKDDYWTFGTIERTSAIDRGVFATPIWADASGNIYNHEINFDHDGSSVYVESGPITLGNGDQVMKVNNLIPDEATQGDVAVTFKTRFYPNDTERSYGPYAMNNPTSVRFTGRQIRMRIEGTEYTNWRTGVMRIKAIPGGER